MVVRGEEGPRAARCDASVFRDSLRDGETVFRTGAAPDFVQHDETPFGGVAENLRRFHHLDKERTRPRREVVLRPDAGEDAIYDADGRRDLPGRTRPLAPSSTIEGDLPQIRAFARHVWPCEQHEPRIPLG